ncbi:MAG: hypothetical protein OXJ90_13760 [Spirochaetaceae bacterium]|nr:hypothetical protein [Spirochaetaceae bacterium]
MGHDHMTLMRMVGKHGLCPPARSKALAAGVAAVALIGCSGVGTRAPATDTTVVEETIAVTAAWSLSRTCDRNPRIRATASGSTAEAFDLTGTGGSKRLATAKYRNVSATVELRCDGVVLATETIAAPTGTLKLTRGSANSVKVAWTEQG